MSHSILYDPNHLQENKRKKFEKISYKFRNEKIQKFNVWKFWRKMKNIEKCEENIIRKNNCVKRGKKVKFLFRMPNEKELKKKKSKNMKNFEKPWHEEML